MKEENLRERIKTLLEWLKGSESPLERKNLISHLMEDLEDYSIEKNPPEYADSLYYDEEEDDSYVRQEAFKRGFIEALTINGIIKQQPMNEELNKQVDITNTIPTYQGPGFNQMKQTDPCENCPNNPKNNPNASGICNCALPYFANPIR